MRTVGLTFLLVSLGMMPLAIAAAFPEAEIASSALRAKLYLPDPENGYYRGTRFDWSGQIASLQYKGHEYFGQWFEHYDPKLHDAIMGPVEEYRSDEGGPGYNDAKAGGTFMRIGAGIVRKPEEKSYQIFKTYEIVDPGRWAVRRGNDWIEFTHRLGDASGYQYVYTKTIRFAKDRPQMVIEHRLQNTGRKPIQTAMYDHNFFTIDNQVTGPDVSIGFGFDPKATKELIGAHIEGRKLVYEAPIEKGKSVATEFAGFGPDAKDYDFRIENLKSGAGVHIRGDKPVQKIVFWSIRSTACPEPYIQISADPGKEDRWKFTYDFYTLDGPK